MTHRIAITVGLLLIVASLIWLIAGIVGVISVDVLSISGASGLRTLASFSVLGCMIAALGCWKQEQETLLCSEIQTSSSS